MEKRKIGPLEVTVVGVGGNNFGQRLDAAATARVVHAGLDAGINFFDTSDNYGGTHSEEHLGQALKGRRSQAVIATKFGTKIDEARPGGAHPDYIRRAVEDSLKRLGIDCIDLYQQHWHDPKVPITDTLDALDDLVRAGKVRAIGCSNLTGEQLRAAMQAAKGRTRFVSLQNQYSALHREPEREVIAECLRNDMKFIPFSPLASGLLSGKYRQGQPMPEGSRLSDTERYKRFLSERNFATAEALRVYASSRGHSLLDLAVSWLASRPAVASVIAGAMNADQVQANAAAVSWRLTQPELDEIDVILKAAS